MNIPNVRIESGLELRVRLKDNGVSLDWSSLQGVKALLYSVEQKAVAGAAEVAIDNENPQILIVKYPGSSPQYTGLAKLIVRCDYNGKQKTYDTAVANFVETTDEATGVIVLDDPTISVGISVEDVSTSLLDEAINAAFAAAEEAMSAAQQAKDEADKLPGIAADLQNAIDTAAATNSEIKSNESERLKSEQKRENSESARVAAERARASAEEARKAAEDSRINKENQRINAESQRESNESEREARDNQRIAEFSNMKSTISDRLSLVDQSLEEITQSENDRVTNETERIAAEEQRKVNESERDMQEQTRQQQEQTRQHEFQSAEQSRQATFAASESARDTEFQSKESQRDAAMQTISQEAQKLTELDKQINGVISETKNRGGNFTDYLKPFSVEEGKTYSLNVQSFGNRGDDGVNIFLYYADDTHYTLGSIPSGDTEFRTSFTATKSDNGAYIKIYSPVGWDGFTCTVETNDGLSQKLTSVESDLDTIEQKVQNIIDDIGVEVDTTETFDNVSCATSPKYNKIILNYATKGHNSKLRIDLTNIVGEYSTIRASWGDTFSNLSKISDTHYAADLSLDGYAKGTNVSIRVYVLAPSTIGSCDISVHETSQAEDGTILDRLESLERTVGVVNISTSDSQIEIYNKLKNANDKGDCDVHFENGTYNFDETLYDYMYNTLGMRVGFELPIGGGCRYYFHGATLIGSYNGSIQTVHENCNVIGCRQTNGNFELHEGTIIANDIVYCVHDDVGQRGSSHVHKHINMHYVYNGGEFAKTNYICKCIGGGTGLNLVDVIDNCVLEKYTENADKNCVTFHGITSAISVQSTARIIISNTYMTGGCGVYHASESKDMETLEFIINNCVTTNINHSNVDFYKGWNNVTESEL